MKNIALRKYVLSVTIYTAVWLLLLVLFDQVLNGYVVDLVEDYFGWGAALSVSISKIPIAFVIFIIGLIILSVYHVIKLSRLLTTAGYNISRDPQTLLAGKNPEELRQFNARLLEFKTAIKENEQAMQLAEQQKNDLILYLAHDLKTPLTSVIGYLDILAESGDLPEPQRNKYTAIALDKAYRLEQLINEFFEITKLNLQDLTQNAGTVNLTVLMLQILDEFYPEFERKQLVVNQAVDPDIKVVGNADQLVRVFENLVKNAVNYSFEQTALDVAVVSFNDSQALVMIRNHGEEIPPEKLNRLFDKFYRADNARQSGTGGSGLGLAIARQIVEAYGGTIHASSTAGCTEFKVFLPKMD